MATLLHLVVYSLTVVAYAVLVALPFAPFLIDVGQWTDESPIAYEGPSAYEAAIRGLELAKEEDDTDLYRYFIATIRDNDLNALHTAIERYGVERVNDAIKEFDFDVKEDFTLMEIATHYNRLNILEAMVNAGADVNKVNAAGSTTILDTALQSGHLEIVDYLLTVGAKTGGDFLGLTPLHQAARLGNRALVELLLARGADVMAQTQLRATPLHWAGLRPPNEVDYPYDPFGVVNRLLQAFADPYAQDANGYDPITFAARKQNFAVVEALLVHGIDPMVGIQHSSTGEGDVDDAAHVVNQRLSTSLLTSGIEPTKEIMLVVMKTLYGDANAAENQ